MKKRMSKSRIVTILTSHIPEFLGCVVIAVLLSPTFCSAQLNEEPIRREHTVSKASGSTQARRSTVPLPIPFWDDFSSTPVSPGNLNQGFPSDTLWETGSNVWITTGVGINPPSRNVASLDGLDSLGVPYNAQGMPNGGRDTLTSLPINLSTTYVSFAERPSVYLSFFYQWAGNGDAPENIDILNIEFLDKDERWTLIATIRPTVGMERNVFYDTLIQLAEEKYFHGAFQFRFANSGRLSGRYDNWNIDYVYLDKGRNANQRAYLDGAIASAVGPLFGDYFAMPMRHFDQAPLLGPTEVDVYNLRGEDGEPDPYSYRTRADFTNYSGGTATKSTALLTPADRPVKPGNPLLTPFERARIVSLQEDLPDSTNATYFNQSADSIDVKINYLLLSNDDGFFRANDSVSATYKLRNYYAYDDGSAEFSVYLNEPDDRVALRFDLPGDVEGEVTAIDVYIPSYTVSGFMTGDFFVMDADESGSPREVISAVTQVIRKTGRDKFQRVTLTRSANVSGTFFIGWKGAFASTLYVGKDSEHESGDKIYVNAFGTWKQNASIRGSLMIRPVFGTPGTQVGIEKEGGRFSVYPVPSSGTFYVEGLEGLPEEIHITSASGSLIPFDMAPEDDRLRLTLNSPSAGLYILRMKKGTLIETKKIIVR
jgi:hypothetical protein